MLSIQVIPILTILTTDNNDGENLMTDRIQVGIFSGPWSTPYVARDGATLAFEDLETALLKAQISGKLSGIDVRPIELVTILDPGFSEVLRSLDILFCNCGPLTSIILATRAEAGLTLPLVREIHTLGWVGTLFQEFVARDLALSTDLTLHASQYAADIWRGLTQNNSIVVHQPIIQSKSIDYSCSQPIIKPKRLRSCFLSRFALDKGIHQLPVLVQRLQQAGWPIDILEIAGRVIDTTSLINVNMALRRLNVKLVNHGQITREAALMLIQKTDMLFFPSTSSFEALGRVVVEACAFGKIVIAADYCGAHDLLAPNYLVPMKKQFTIGNSMNPFPIADLATDIWEPPVFSSLQPSIRSQTALNPYKYNASYFSTILDATLNSVPIPFIERKPPILMNVDLDSYSNCSVEAWVAELRRGIVELKVSRKNLNDLGGVFKSCLQAIGFKPEVSFFPREEL
jgi:glycosyltransferase involved in cell wall biosynthesis